MMFAHLKRGLGTQPTWMLLALTAGLGGGMMLDASGATWIQTAATVASTVGGVWIDALKMTIVPLVFALAVTGLNTTAAGLSGGAVSARALVLFGVLLVAAVAVSALITPAVLAAAPPSPIGDMASSSDLGSVATATPASTGVALLRSLVPANPIRAAADGAMAPLVVFALIFGFATQRVDATHRNQIVQLFEALAQVMLKIIRAVLIVSPIGVFALAIAVGMKAGMAVAGALAYYVALVCGVCLMVAALIYAAAAMWVRQPFGLYARALAPAQLIAFSTQSSLAAMPAAILGAERLELRPSVVKILPPLAVTIFRITAPPANLAGALYLASLYGLSPDPVQITAAAAIAIVSSFSSVGLPVQISFLAMLAPVCLALGVPLELLPLLLAVEPLADTCRTLGNVTGQFASLCFLGRDHPAP